MQLSFFKKLQDLGIVPSRSEAIRQCINTAMPYFDELINLYTNKINNLPEKEIKQLTTAIKSKPLEKLGNKYWGDRFVNNKWIKVPVIPEDEEVTEVFVDGIGYIKVE